LAFLLALFPAGIAAAFSMSVDPAAALVIGLILFGAAFALNSSVHSFLILAYTEKKDVAMSVGIYYMANACGRLAGTVLSGLLYQMGLQSGPHGGMVWCLWASCALVLVAAFFSLALPQRVLAPASEAG
jgi:MFS family permease